MRKEAKFQSNLDKKFSILKEKGVSDDWISLLRTSINSQKQIVPTESILQWLDEQISKFKPPFQNRNSGKEKIKVGHRF